MPNETRCQHNSPPIESNLEQQATAVAMVVATAFSPMIGNRRQSVSQRHSVVSYRANLSKGHPPLPQQNCSYSLSSKYRTFTKNKSVI